MWVSTTRFVVVAAGLGWILSSSAAAIPQFARKYDVSCTQCHIIPPKLNAFGEAFVARGYQAPELTPRKTWPLAVWVTARGESRPVTGRERDEIGPYVNRVEIISGGRLIHPRLSYFVEWRAVSQETRSDGTFRNRSGRFEDLFLNGALTDNLDLTVGQFRQVAQVDISRRLSLSEPLVLSASLSGEGGKTPPGSVPSEASLPPAALPLSASPGTGTSPPAGDGPPPPPCPSLGSSLSP